ncbi:SDR family NAD(P)-dependent oxidoreductase, partial [Novipirellula sp.]|uniref:SDR family NAD(P)-dependent oxidoreductase n=1 Tax=Novipirellula sp. TaxID=2795430 RepID=UPI00356217F2
VPCLLGGASFFGISGSYVNIAIERHTLGESIDKYQIRKQDSHCDGLDCGNRLRDRNGIECRRAGVVIIGRSQSRFDEAIKTLAGKRKELDQGNSGPIRGVAADLATVDGYQHFVAEMPRADILVNNLGIIAPKPLFEILDEDWEHFFQTNVMSACRPALFIHPKFIC